MKNIGSNPIKSECSFFGQMVQAIVCKTINFINVSCLYAEMAEQVDAPHSKCGVGRRVGSSPTFGTTLVGNLRYSECRTQGKRYCGERRLASLSPVWLIDQRPYLTERKPNRRGGNVLCPQWKMRYAAKQPEKLLGVAVTAESKSDNFIWVGIPSGEGSGL